MTLDYCLKGYFTEERIEKCGSMWQHRQAKLKGTVQWPQIHLAIDIFISVKTSSFTLN